MCPSIKKSPDGERQGDGDKISYIEFLEDTFGTASSFRAAGTWHFRGAATGDEVSVGS